jgi:hypothetical protein
MLVNLYTTMSSNAWFGLNKTKSQSLDKKWATFIMMPTLHQMLHVAWNSLRWREKKSNLIIFLDYCHTKKILIDHYTNFIQRWCIKGKEIWDLIHKFGATFVLQKTLRWNYKLAIAKIMFKWARVYRRYYMTN